MSLTTPQIDPSDLKKFLSFVVQGEQSQSESLLKQNPHLALLPGDVTDLSNRSFSHITAFQYSLWSLDHHMCTMLLKYLPLEDALLQCSSTETASWMTDHGIHTNWSSLTNALQTCIDLYNSQKFEDGNVAWVQQVGGAQRLLPAHVVNEYCHPTRSFEPGTNFMDEGELPRSRRVYVVGWMGVQEGGEWFECSLEGEVLGKSYAHVRIDGKVVCYAERGVWLLSLLRRGFLREECVVQQASLLELYNARMKQRSDLIDELKTKSQKMVEERK